MISLISFSQCEACQECTWAKERCSGLSMALAASHLWASSRIVSTGGSDLCGSVLHSPAGQSDQECWVSYPADAKGPRADEHPTPQGHHRYHRGDGHADH